MGKIIELDTGLVMPSQCGLVGSKIEEVVRSYIGNPKKVVVPVRQHPDDENKFILIDGHHIACVSDTFNDLGKFVQIYGWVADSSKDFIGALPSNFHNDKTYMKNYLIQQWYDQVLKLAYNGDVPSSISEMRGKYLALESPEKLIDFVCGGISNAYMMQE